MPIGLTDTFYWKRQLKQLRQFCESNGIELKFIHPGKPVRNAFVERNNGSLRKELLNAYMFYSLAEVRQMAEEWQNDYTAQDHTSLWALFHRWNIINPGPFDN